jgi:hypothetical protein
MPIEAQTAVTKEVYIDMWKYNLFQKTSGRIATIFAFFFSFFLIAAGLFLKSFEEDEFFPILCLTTGLVLLVALLFIIFALPGMIYSKNISSLAKKTQHYVFENDYFTVRAGGNEEEGFSKIKYSSLSKVHETKNYFYIYISNLQAYVLDKSQITNASPEELSRLLQSSLEKNRYKKK